MGGNVVGVLVVNMLLVVANCVFDVARSWWAQRWVCAPTRGGVRVACVTFYDNNLPKRHHHDN